MHREPLRNWENNPFLRFRTTIYLRCTEMNLADELRSLVNKLRNIAPQYLGNVRMVVVVKSYEGDALSVVIDNGNVELVEGAKEEADLVIEGSRELLVKLLRGEANAYAAYLRGEIKVRGDLSRALTLISAIEKARG